LKVLVNDANGRWIDKDSKEAKEVQTREVEIDKFSVGQMAGLEMALDSMRLAGFSEFQFRDFVTIECTGVQEPTQRGHSPMPEFTVTISDK
jgi:hypothetical protein